MLNDDKDPSAGAGGFARDVGKGLLDDAKRSFRNGLLVGGILAAACGVVGFFLFGFQGLLIGTGGGFVVGFILGFAGPALFY